MKSLARSFSLLFCSMVLTSTAIARDRAYGKRTDALPSDAWECSEWISAADAPVVDGKIKDGSRAADGSNWFVTCVRNERKVKSAVWMTTGLGVYDLYVNGRLVGDEILKPGFTNPKKTKLSFTYDVTDAFSRAKGKVNQLSARVTPGWWGDKIVTPSGRMCMYGRKCAFRSVLRITYSDGTSVQYGTDTKGWKAGIAGPVTHAAIFDGEDYDARKPEGYEVADGLGVPETNNEFDGEIVPSAGAEVFFRKDLELKPLKTYIWKEVEGADKDAYGKVVTSREYATGKRIQLHLGETLVVDFGQNCAAVPSFVFNAAEGTTLTCLPAELLNDGNGAKSRGMDGPEGSVHRQNLRIPKSGMILNYTFAASGKPVSFTPRCTFFGYRYISVTATGDVTFESISSIPVSSITKEMECGTLTTGNSLVNKLISNTLWSQRSNYLSVTTDCPQRNERLGWTADTQVFAETGSFFAKTGAFFHKWMRDMRDTQSPFGGYPGVAPWAQYGASSTTMMRVGWADAGIIVPWTVWKQFGDSAIIDECWDSMVKFMDHVNSTKYDHNALKEENGDNQFADWLSYEPLESCGLGAFTKDEKGYRIPKPEAVEYWNFLSASYWAMDASMMRDMAAATGRDASVYDAMVSAAKDYIINTFFDSDGSFKNVILNTMQTPALFALRNGLFDGEAKEAVCARLRKNFEEHGNCLQTGFLGTSILMPTLSENGMTDIAYELLLQRKNPSWLYSVDNGATTIWERWNSYMLDKGMGPRGMNSFNHYAYGCVCEWIWETAAGIAADPAEPGFRHIIMKPVPDRRLGSVDAVYNSAAGRITSKWKYDGDVWTWTFSIPEGARATVTLPGETVSKDYQSGTHTLKIKL